MDILGTSYNFSTPSHSFSSKLVTNTRTSIQGVNATHVVPRTRVYARRARRTKRLTGVQPKITLPFKCHFVHVACCLQIAHAVCIMYSYFVCIKCAHPTVLVRRKYVCVQCVCNVFFTSPPPQTKTGYQVLATTLQTCCSLESTEQAVLVRALGMGISRTDHG